MDPDIQSLIDLRDLLERLSENNLQRGGNGMTFPDEIELLNRVIKRLESPSL